MTKRIFPALALVVSALLIFSGCNNSEIPPKVSDDEILLLIQLDTKEDIGLLIADYSSEKFNGSGGTSNADGSMLRHDDLLYYTLEKRDYDGPSVIKDFSLQFTVITEYFTPNFENIYPPECTKPLDAVDMEVSFGETYYITITGDSANGYKAVLG